MSQKHIIIPIIILGIVLISLIFFLKTKPEINQKKEVSLDEKIGEMLILGFRGTEVNESSKIIQDINQYHLGGVVLFDYDLPSKSFPRNIENFEQTKKLIDDIKN